MDSFFTSFLLSLSTLFSCQQSKDYTTLSVKEFQALINDGNIQVADVRTLGEYSEGHIAHSVNINILSSSFDQVADSVLKKDVPVALYCRSGHRSKKAGKRLAKKGYTVYELDGGFMAWERAGLEETK
ncbi:rhodanese-like domain-containing protein [uncultured Bacteroides sp.]|uniref:rhodanese-like domain-containing protein n=1 Tax=uncultured Bacteroides sp. TaxID=162156 RepID=UPI002AAC282B|nr:rhodanese-like domain-containing protein [uncultured Bacteroides sp.]